jgi:hypothetical protein
MLFINRLHRPVLITGHPRCGTTSAATMCRKIDLYVGDEWVGPHGISSWMMAVDDRRNPFSLDEFGRSRRHLKWDWLFQVVRDIEASVPSVIIENERAPASYAFRRKHIQKQMGIDLDAAPNPMAKAVQSIVCWTRIIQQQQPHFSFRIEDQQERFRDFLVEHKIADAAAAEIPVNENTNAQKIYYGVRYEKYELSHSDWSGLEPRLKDEVVWYCDTFGYKNPLSV